MIQIAFPLLFVILSFFMFLSPFVGAFVTYLTPRENYTVWYRWLQLFLYGVIVIVAGFMSISQLWSDYLILLIFAGVLLWFLVEYFHTYKQVLTIFLAPLLFFGVQGSYAPIMVSFIFLYGFFF